MTETPIQSEYRSNPNNEAPEKSKVFRITGLAGGKNPPPKDEPPKRTRAKTGNNSSRNSSTPDYVPGVIAEGMANMYGQIGMMWGMFDPTCGVALVDNAQKMAQAAERLAKESPAARKFLTNIVTTSVIGEFVAAHIPLVAAIAMHHVPAVRNRMNPPEPVTPDSGIGPNTKPGVV